MTTRGDCTICGRPVTTIQTAAWPVTGWEVERSGGGANAIRNRQREPDQIAHATCLQRELRRGVAQGSLIAGQESLFD